MTDTATKTDTADTTTEQTSSNPFDLIPADSSYAPLIKAALEQIIVETETANAHATKVISAGNEELLVSEVRENSDDPTIVKFRTEMDKINEAILAKINAIDTYIRENGLVSTEPVDIEAETAAYREAVARIKAFATSLKVIPDSAPVIGALPAVKALPGTSGGRGGAARSTGPKPRLAQTFIDGEDIFTVKKNEKDGTETHSATFTVLAAALSKKAGVKVEVKDIQAAAFAEAKTQDLSSLNGKPFEFIFNAGKDGEEKNYTIKVVPAVSK